jgi:hypothetical protein
MIIFPIIESIRVWNRPRPALIVPINAVFLALSEDFRDKGKKDS